MANERDAFTSTGIGGLNQERDFETGTIGASGTLDSNTGQPVTARAKEAVSSAGHKAAERVQERLADQMSRATGQLENVASSLRTAGTQMPDDGIGRYMVQAATQVDNLASFLNNREVGELVDEVEDFARRQPAVFLGGAFALGILGARFLRSSRQNMGPGYDRGSRSSYLNDNQDSLTGSRGATSFRSPIDSSRTGYDTGYEGSSAGGDTGLSSSGYATGSRQSSADYGRTPGGMTGSRTEFGATSGSGPASGPGSSTRTSSSTNSSTNRDLASDLPGGSRAPGSSTGGMTGSGTAGSGTPGSAGSITDRERSLGQSLTGDDETRTSAFGNDNLSARPGSGLDHASRDQQEPDPRSPDFL